MKIVKGKYLCRVCEEYKYRRDFHKRKAEKNGIAKICKVCVRRKARKLYVKTKTKKMSSTVEALRKLYTKRIAIIKKAGISVDKSGMCPRIDRVLKRNGLYNG